jgi:hypothetical protein
VAGVETECCGSIILGDEVLGRDRETFEVATDRLKYSLHHGIRAGQLAPVVRSPFSLDPLYLWIQQRERGFGFTPALQISQHYT